MNEKTLKALVDAGAVKKVKIIGNGSTFHVEIMTPNDRIVAETTKGKIKTWASLDSAAKWVRGLGIGKAELQIGKWLPDQRGISF